MIESSFTNFSEIKFAPVQQEKMTIESTNLPRKDCISFLALQASEIAIENETIVPKHFSIENIPFIEMINDSNSQIQNRPKPRTRCPKLCKICSKSVLDLRRHLEQCHKELTRLQIVKIVAESKRFRKDLKKNPSKAVRNVLLCPHTSDNGEVCNRPIVEYKLYQHLKFYHHIHPKSEEGIRLVRQARANPFACKSIFHENSQESSSVSNETNSSDNSDPIKESESLHFDFDSDRYEVRVSFPNTESAPEQMPLYSEANSTHIIQPSPIQSIIQPSPIQSIIQPSPIQSIIQPSPIQSIIQPSPIQSLITSDSPFPKYELSSSPSSSASPPTPGKFRIATQPNIACQVLSIGINLAVSCSNLPTLVAPQEATCVITKHDKDVVYISIPNLSVNEP